MFYVGDAIGKQEGIASDLYYVKDGETMTFVHVSSGASAGGFSFSISFIPLLLSIAMQQKKAPRPNT